MFFFLFEAKNFIRKLHKFGGASNGIDGFWVSQGFSKSRRRLLPSCVFFYRTLPAGPPVFELGDQIAAGESLSRLWMNFEQRGSGYKFKVFG